MPPTHWDPEWIELAQTLGPPPTLPDTLEAKKALVNDILLNLPKLLPPPPSNVESQDVQLPSGPPIRVYTPTPTAATTLPTLLFAHGGGWFAGDLETEDRTCRILSSRLPARIVSVGYRCDFSVPLSDMVEDLHKAFDYIRGVDDPREMVLLGGSAGGSLVLALMYKLVKEGRGGEVKGLVSMNGLAIHPDATPEGYKGLMKSYEENDGLLPFVSGKDTLWLYETRGLLKEGKLDTDLFPVAGGAEAMRGFPRTFVITSGNDASRDDGTVLEACLRDAGVEVRRENVEGLAHYFWVFNLPKANERFWESLVEGIRWTLEK